MATLPALASLVLAFAFQEQGAELRLVRGASVPTLDWKSEVYTVRSEALNEDLRLFVAKPPSFERSPRALPVLLLLDGQYYFAEALSVVAALADYGQIPELLLVGIESHDRRVDFTPSGIYLDDVGDRARATTYLDFLEHELVPALESQLRAGKPRVLLGHSHAAMFVVHAVSARPSVFPWAVAVDAPAHHDDGFLARDLVRALGERERPPVRVVSQERVFGWSDEQWASLQAAARPGDLLTREKMPEETHDSMLFPAAYRGLQALFADSSALRMRELSPLELDERYAALAPLYGTEVAPPEPLMRQTVEDFLMEGRGAKAGEWLERYVATYGAPADFDELGVRVKEVTALGEPTETVAGLLALPRATPAEMKDHLGTWKGTTWMEGARRSGLTVRFWVEDGMVQGELLLEQGPPMRVEYLRFRADGALEFGFKNGMRPRGLIMYEEKTPGGPLEGDIPFRGMNFVLPHGETMPPRHFELERVTDD